MLAFEDDMTPSELEPQLRGCLGYLEERRALAAAAAAVWEDREQAFHYARELRDARDRYDYALLQWRKAGGDGDATKFGPSPRPLTIELTDLAAAERRLAGRFSDACDCDFCEWLRREKR